MKVQQLLKACEHLLEPSADAGWDAREIVCTALKIEPARFLRAYSDEAPTETVKSALAWAERRKMGEPLQYVLGRAWFMGLPFFVNESVLIPRQDTETLCELALQYIKEHPVSRALDLCTGSGDRSERIRTYNYPQGRVTDHRINLTLYKLPQFLNGDMDEMLDALIFADQTARLEAENLG